MKEKKTCSSKIAGKIAPVTPPSTYKFLSNSNKKLYNIYSSNNPLQLDFGIYKHTDKTKIIGGGW